jgi:RimJ/RimL family protein N-acetyltransferase
MPPFPPLEEPLVDTHVVLREGAERDIPEILIAYQDDAQLHVRLGEARPPSGAQLGRRAELALAERQAGTRVTLTILKPGSDTCVGQVNVDHVDWDHARTQLGIWLAPQVRGAGLAARALRLAARWLFDACGLERIELLIGPDNEPMLRAGRAAGFSTEGVLRRYQRERGARVDVAVLSLLPADIGRG